MSQQDELSKFKKIISKLPEEKRKFLYKRLQSLPPDEVFVISFMHLISRQ